MAMKYLKRIARLLDNDHVNRRGLDLFKKVLWVSLGQRAADRWAIKVEGQKRILPIGCVREKLV